MYIKTITLTLLALVVSLTTMADNVYTIYPVPQNQKALPGKASFTKQVNIVADALIDHTTLERAKAVLADHGLQGVVTTKPSAKLATLYLEIGRASCRERV